MMEKKRGKRASLAPRLAGITRSVPGPVWKALRPVFRVGLLALPGPRRRVRAAMEAALGPQGRHPDPAREYYRHIADLIAFTAMVYRDGIRTPGLDQEFVHDPQARDQYHASLSLGKGVLMVGPHLVGHEIMVGTATQEVPITVLVRKSPDAAYEAVKQRWYSQMGVEVAYRAQRGSPLQGLGDMTVSLRALRKNRVLAITPDLIRKPGTGVPVRLFGREAELPAGPFFLALRTGAPLLPSFFHHEDGHYRLWTHPPLELPPWDEIADREAAIAECAQKWTGLFEAFVRKHPDMWQFWLDKRWRRWLGLAD